MSRNKLLALAVLGCFLVAASTMACYSKRSSDVGGTETEVSVPPQLTVGIQVSPAMALVMVAEDEGLFDKNGVDVVIEEFTAGKFALQAFLGDSLDIAVSGEVPVALSTLQGNQFRVIAQVVDHTINEVRVVALQEAGLDTAEKYFGAKRRKLATSFGGGPEFFTYSFLKRHEISDVELISQRPEDMPAALLSGSVDAISIFDPFARIAERELGHRGITFVDEGIYSELYVVNVKQAVIDNRAADLRAFLRGLADAEKFIAANPGRAQAIVERYTKLEAAVIDEIWSNFVFKVSLNDLFVNYTTAQAKWAIEKGDVPAGTLIPDFRQVLAPELLSEVDSAAVRLTDPVP